MGSGDLLTTCAGSGATLVAIVGGFLLTRYMAVESEIKGADRAVRQVNGHLETAVLRQETADRELTDYDVDEALASDDFLLALVTAFDQSVQLGLEEARSLVALEDYTDAEVERRLAVWRNEVARARASAVWDLVPPEFTYASLRSFAQSHKVVMRIEPIWSFLYEAEKERKRRTYSMTFGPVEIDAFDLDDPDAQRRPAFETRLHDAQVSQQLIEAELRMAQTHRASIGEPTGLRWEVVILATVGALTIVPSLLFLAPQPATLSRSESAAVLAAFLAGFVLLIGYLLTYANRASGAWHAGLNSQGGLSETSGSSPTPDPAS